MTAVVRIKRRLDEEPSDLLVLNCKRRKANEDEVSDEKTEVSAVLKFAATVQEEGNIQSVLHRHSEKEELKQHFKKHTPKIADKIRAQIQESSKNNRYKVVNCFRSHKLEEPSKDNTDVNSMYTVFDVETDLNENDSTTVNRNYEPKYVYDLYYTNSDDFGDADIGDYISVHPVNDPLMYGSIRDNGLAEPDSEDDSEDSNAECNWKNDYPDESDVESIDEGDMVKAVENLGIDDLSSDEGDEQYVYSLDSEDEFREVDEEAASRYGRMYAKFKAKNTVQTSSLNHDLYYGDIDEEEYYY